MNHDRACTPPPSPIPVAVKFCGGCNPDFDRSAYFDAIRRSAGSAVTWTDHGDNRAARLLLICGCPTRCPLPELPPAADLVVVSDDHRPAPEIAARLSTPIDRRPGPRFIYWLTPDRLRKVQDAHRRLFTTDLPLVRRLPCLALSGRLTLAAVPPEAWDGPCRRQGSWYRTSPRRGRYLVVSARPLAWVPADPAAEIRPTDFIPPQRADEKARAALVADSRLDRRLPAGWIAAGELPGASLAWARRLGATVQDPGALVQIHTANHANFLTPHLFVEDPAGRRIPYAIDRSAHLCSCCIELFAVITPPDGQMLVAPCPGAVICAGLPADRFWRVTTFDRC